MVHLSVLLIVRHYDRNLFRPIIVHSFCVYVSYVVSVNAAIAVGNTHEVLLMSITAAAAAAATAYSATITSGLDRKLIGLPTKTRLTKQPKPAQDGFG